MEDYVTIQERLQIEVRLTGYHSGLPSYTADAKCMPGMPPVGKGSTEEEAVLDLLNKLYNSDTYYKLLEMELF